jgi:hypothetical protein
MLQALHLDVSKVHRDIAHVAMVFQLYVPNVSSVLDICCAQRFHLDVTKVNLMFECCSGTHLLAATRPSCMRVEAEEHEQQAREMRAHVDRGMRWKCSGIGPT